MAEADAYGYGKYGRTTVSGDWSAVPSQQAYDAFYPSKCSDSLRRRLRSL